MNDDLVSHLGREALRAAPPVAVTAYTVLSKGLPFVISVMTLIYLSLQIANLTWRWLGDIHRRREIDRALKGPVAEYKPRKLR